MQQRPFSQRMAQRVGSSPSGLPSPAAAGGARKGAAIAAGLLWLAAGLSAGYWLLKASGQGEVTPLQGLAMSAPQADRDSVARALGAQPDAGPAAGVPVSAGPLRLLGVISQGRFRGAALIETDGQPPRPLQVGAVVGEGLVLQSVGRNTVQLGETQSGPTTMELTLPVQATGVAPLQ